MIGPLILSGIDVIVYGLHSLMLASPGRVSQIMGRDPNVGRYDFIDESLAQEGRCVVLDSSLNH